MSTIIAIDEVSVTYHGRAGKVSALSECTVEAVGGEVVVVVGPSGSGKTTLLMTAGGLLRPDSGRVIVQETDIYALDWSARCRFRNSVVGFVFQQFYLVPYLTSFENILLPAVAGGTKPDETRAEQLIAHFGLEHRRDHVPAELSTGERQRVGMARALFNKPDLILADEPTGNLDPENAQRVLGYLRDAAQAGAAVLMVTHEATAREAADRCYNFNDGSVQSSTKE